jgi:hypothetical protein
MSMIFCFNVTTSFLQQLLLIELMLAVSLASHVSFTVLEMLLQPLAHGDECASPTLGSESGDGGRVAGLRLKCFDIDRRTPLDPCGPRLARVIALAVVFTYFFVF